MAREFTPTPVEAQPVNNTFDPRLFSDNQNQPTIMDRVMNSGLVNEQIVNSVFTRAQQAASNLANIESARAQRENERARLDLEKKKAEADIGLAQHKGELTQFAADRLREQFKVAHSHASKLYDAQDVITAHAEDQHKNELNDSLGFMSALSQAQTQSPYAMQSELMPSNNSTRPLAMAPAQVPSMAAPSIPMNGRVEASWADEMDNLRMQGIDPAEVFKDTGIYVPKEQKADAREGVQISDQEIDRKADAVIEGRMAPSQLPKFGGAASIFNKVTERVLEKEPSFDFAQADMGYSSDKASLLQVKKQKAMVGSFERTANKNANVLEMLADKVDGRTRSPKINQLKQAWASDFIQDEDLAAAKTALVTFTTEYAKIMSGQTGGAAVSDSARREASELIRLTDKPSAFQARIKVMKQDMKNRMSGFDEEIGSLTGKPVEETSGTEQLNNQPEEWQSSPGGAKYRILK